MKDISLYALIAIIVLSIGYQIAQAILDSRIEKKRRKDSEHDR